MELLDLKNILITSPITAVSTLFVLVLGISYLALKGRPRGPRGLPYFGILPYLKNETAHITLQELTKKYGDVYCFTSLGRVYVHLGTIKAAKEAHVTKADFFAQRFDSFSFFSLTFDDGLVTSSGEKWKTIRKFFVQAFREFGLVSMKDYLEGPIYESIEGTVSKLKTFEDKTVNVGSILTIQSSTIMKRTLFNDSGINDEELKNLIENFEKVLGVFVNIASLYQGEFARYVLFPRLPAYKAAMEGKKNMVKIFREVIKRHEDTYNEGEIKDLIDSYIKERNERRKKNDPTAAYFTESCLIYTLLQIVGDGVTTIAFFISYVLFTLLEYPEEQEKIFKELEEVVGLNRGITLEDKSKLTYTNAFIQETIRMGDFFNILPSLECTSEHK